MSSIGKTHPKQIKHPPLDVGFVTVTDMISDKNKTKHKSLYLALPVDKDGARWADFFEFGLADVQGGSD